MRFRASAVRSRLGRAARQGVLAWASPDGRNSIGTKVTPEDAERIQTLAGEQPVSDGFVGALLKAAKIHQQRLMRPCSPSCWRSGPSSSISTSICAAVLLPSFQHDTMQRSIERADEDKGRLAEARLTRAERRVP